MYDIDGGLQRSGIDPGALAIKKSATGCWETRVWNSTLSEKQLAMSLSSAEESSSTPADGGSATDPSHGPPPPPEQPKSTWTRRLIILAFWAVIVTLGWPHWVFTTSIHRSDLPLESMNRWADGKVSPSLLLKLGPLTLFYRHVNFTTLSTLDSPGMTMTLAKSKI